MEEAVILELIAERAAIMEIDGGLSGILARTLAIHFTSCYFIDLMVEAQKRKDNKK